MGQLRRNNVTMLALNGASLLWTDRRGNMHYVSRTVGTSDEYLTWGDGQFVWSESHATALSNHELVMALQWLGDEYVRITTDHF